MGDSRHIGKIEKLPYISHSLTDRHKIWHGDAVWPSWSFRPLEFQKFKNPRWRRPVVKCSDTLHHLCKNGWLIEMPFGLSTWVGPRKHVLDGSQIPHAKGQLFEDRTCLGMPDDTLAWAVQKWLNRSICQLVVNLGGTKEAQGQSYSPGGGPMRAPGP